MAQFQATVNNGKELVFEEQDGQLAINGEILQPDIMTDENGRMHVLLNDKSYNCELVSSDAEEASCGDASCGDRVEDGLEEAASPAEPNDDSSGVGKAKRAPSLAESLERGSDLNHRLFDHDGQETVLTDDGSCWLDQGSVSGMNIRSSASVVAPQLSFDQNLTKILEHA